jgi:glycerol uptake facilitator-like aquaporin
MNTTIEQTKNKQVSLRKMLKTKTVLLNTLAELIASTIFSSLYFIFISRYLNEKFHTDYVMLSFSVGLAFFAAVYIPFHTYRIHIIPFITLITSLRRKNPFILLHKIPAQIVGAFLGVLIFNAINERTTQIDIENYQLINLNDSSLLIFINTITASLLCYGFYMIRVLFKSKQLVGTVYLSLFFSVLFAATSFFANTSALNPFGYLFYDLLGNQTIKEQAIPFIFINHIIAPIVGVLLIFYYIKPKVLSFKK